MGAFPLAFSAVACTLGLWVPTELTCSLLGCDLVISRPATVLLHCKKEGLGAYGWGKGLAFQLRETQNSECQLSLIGGLWESPNMAPGLVGSFQKFEHCDDLLDPGKI